MQETNAYVTLCKVYMQQDMFLYIPKDEIDNYLLKVIFKLDLNLISCGEGIVVFKRGQPFEKFLLYINNQLVLPRKQLESFMNIMKELGIPITFSYCDNNPDICKINRDN